MKWSERGDSNSRPLAPELRRNQNSPYISVLTNTDSSCFVHFAFRYFRPRGRKRLLEENAPRARPMCGSIVGQFVAIISSGLCRFAIVAERGAHPAHPDLPPRESDRSELEFSRSAYRRNRAGDEEGS